MNENAIINVICPECGAEIKLSAGMQYGYCPICTSKISFKDAQQRNLSLHLISSLSGKEIDNLLLNDGCLNIKKAEVASDNGSIWGSIYLGSHYLTEPNYKKAKLYFDRAANKGVVDGVFGASISEIGIMAPALSADFDNAAKKIRTLINKMKKIDLSRFKYLTKNAVASINSAVKEVEGILDDFDAKEAKRSRQAYNYSSSYSSTESYIPVYSEPETPKSDAERYGLGAFGCGIGGSFCGTSGGNAR